MSHLAALPPVITDHLGWVVAGLIVVLGLGVYGFKDLVRLPGGLGRAWAISSVCFADAIRRKVMVLPLLAMLGIVIVSQLQNPLDEQDAIRLDIKFCFFVTALLVTATTIILASTNLPREIENRVVFTIVTKPVTRLEIVLGKILGFAKVSGAILVVMFLFSLLYLNVRSYGFQREIARALENPSTDSGRRASLEHYQQDGLLNARTVGFTRGFQVFAREPRNDAEPRWVVGDSQQIFVRLQPTADELKPIGAPEARPGEGQIRIDLNIAWEKVYDTPAAQATAAASPTDAAPHVSVEILDSETLRSLVASAEMNTTSIKLNDAAGTQPVSIVLNVEQALQLGQSRDFTVLIRGLNPNYNFGLHRQGVTLYVPDLTNQTVKAVIFPPERAPQIFYRGAEGRYGQQLRGPTEGPAPVAIYQFRNMPAVKPTAQGTVPFELRLGVEGSGNEADAEEGTQVTFEVYNRDTQTRSAPVVVYPENDHAVYAQVPKEFVSGNFDVLMVNQTTGRVVGLTPDSIAVIAARQPFALNLFKGLVVLWLFSVLVAAIAVCCSTRLSWPISIMLTLMVLLSRWGVQQLDDSLRPGFGSVFVSDSGLADNAPIAKTISQSVDALTKLLRVFAEVLPDISRFAVTEQIENGVNLSAASVLAPLEVLLMFGLPLVTLAYVFLRNKEVAP